ncbi:MAG: hypothetical protein ACFCUX_10670 [Candidatus Methylacidiphilales bacterium]
MSTLGWLIMITAVGGTTGFLLWCLVSVMRTKEPHVHSPLDIDPGDGDPKDHS